MKKIVVFILSLACFLGVNAGINQQDAINIALKYERDTTNEIMIANHLYYKGDSVGIEGGESLICPFDSAWCIFIDYRPLADWGHECAYVFVEATNGYSNFMLQKFPPKSISKLWTRYRIFVLPADKCNQHRSPLLERLEQQKNNVGAQNQESRITNVRRIIQQRSSTSPQLYAVIINSAISAEQNYERYWNDCSIMYSTLKTYGFDDGNIYVAIGDGNDGTPDFRLNSGNLVQTPMDLDGDGVEDVDYPAIHDSLEIIFSDLSQIVTEEDIVVIYINGISTIAVDLRYNPCRYASCLFVSRPIEDGTFSSMISSLNANVIDIIIQRSESGELTECLQRTIGEQRNYVITNSGMQNDTIVNYQYDKFVFDFVSAANQETPDGISVSSDGNNDGYVSLDEIYQYLEAQRDPSSHYNQITNPACLARSLTLNEIMDNNDCYYSDLYIKDNVQDGGVEPNASTSISYLSPDIWAEDMNGNVVENLVSGETYYICTRIRNRGTIPSAGDEVLYLHWTKAVIGGVWPSSWIEGAEYNCNGNYVSVGGEITPDGGFSLPSIAPNETYVARVLWQTPDNSMYLPCMEFIDNENELWHYCLLARVYDENEHPGEDMTSISMSKFVLQSNNVASKNISIMTPTDNGLSAIVALSVPYDGVFSLRGSVGPSFEGLINGDVYVSLTLSENLYHSWPFEGNGFTELGDNTIQIDLDTVLLTGLYLEENVIYSLKLDVLDNSSANNFMYDIALIDSAGFPIGGEIFKMGEENPHNYFTSPERRRTIQTEDSSNIIKCKQSPIADVVEIDSSSEIISTTLVSAFGDIVQKQNTNVVDISSLPMGVYILIVETQNNIQQFKIVKKQ